MPRKSKPVDLLGLLQPRDNAMLRALVVTAVAPGEPEHWAAMLRPLSGARCVREKPYSWSGEAAVRGEEAALRVRWMVHDGEHTDPGHAHWNFELRRRQLTSVQADSPEFGVLFSAMLNTWPAARKAHNFSVVASYAVAGGKPLRKLERLLSTRLEIDKSLVYETEELMFRAKDDGNNIGALSVALSDGGGTMWVTWSGVVRRRMSAKIFNLAEEMSWMMVRTVIA